MMMFITLNYVICGDIYHYRIQSLYSFQHHTNHEYIFKIDCNSILKLIHTYMQQHKQFPISQLTFETLDEHILNFVRDFNNVKSVN